MSQKDQKTEKPTQQKRRKASTEGRYPVSRDFISALQFLTVLVVGFKYEREAGTALTNLFRQLLRHSLVPEELDANGLQTIFRNFLFPFFSGLFLVGLAILAAMTLIQLGSKGFGLSAHQLIPDFARLNPRSKISQLPKQNIQTVIRSIVLLFAVSYFIYSTIKPQLEHLSNLSTQSLMGGLSNASSLMKSLLKQLAFVLVAAGVIDLIHQRSQFTKNLRMTKQEIKDEIRDSEGNIQLKLRIRRLQHDAMRRSMIKAVQHSSVVIVNPTHYAIALQYEMGSRSVPTVVAKGKNYLAGLIKARAKEYDIPIVENQPLAQALYQAVNVGDEIPANLYRAVAEVLAQIYRIVNRQ